MASGTACLDVGGGVSSARLASGDLISPRLVGLYGVPSARLDCAAARAAAVKGGLEELESIQLTGGDGAGLPTPPAKQELRPAAAAAAAAA